MATGVDDPARLGASPELLKWLRSLEDRVRRLEGAPAGPGEKTPSPPAPRPRAAKPRPKKSHRQKNGKMIKGYKNTEKETNKNERNEDQSGKHRRRKKAFRKLAWWAMPAMVLYSVALGQDIRRGGRFPLGQSLEGGQQAAAALGDRLRRAFRSADGIGADRGAAGKTAPSAVKREQGGEAHGHQRRVEESCSFCPDGLTVDPFTLALGLPCVIAVALYLTIPADTFNCKQVINQWEEVCCPIPVEDLPADLPSASPTSLDQQCPRADTEICGCEINMRSDYNGTLNIPESGDGAQCRPWDSDTVSQYFNLDLIGTSWPQLDQENKYVENYCRGNSRPGCVAQFPFGEPFWAFCDVPECDPCSCVPECGLPNFAPCGCPSARQAEECCDDVADPASCECGYFKEACRKSLENGSTEFCARAEEICCAGNDNPWCTCDVYQQVCEENPSEVTCNLAAESCCIAGFEVASRTRDVNVLCKCDFYTYVAEELGYDPIDSSRKHICEVAQQYYMVRSSGLVVADNNLGLHQIYTALSGIHWYRKDGWDTSPHMTEYTEYNGYCDWYGITCDDDTKSITEINLRNNNLTGNIILGGEGVFRDLVKLDMSQNQISGRVEKDNELGFYDRKLKYLNISSNKFSGHADVLLFPSLKSVDFSHNKFTTVGFRRFQKSYHTLRELDLRSNNIAQSVSEIFVNIPPTLESLDFSNNNIHGNLPTQFPIEKVRFLRMANNRLSGPLPEFPDTSPILEHLVLENNYLTGTIPDSFWKLGDMTELNLASNAFTGVVPNSIGDVTQLRDLRLSSNLLNGTIPEKLGRLEGVSEVLDLSFNDFTGSIPSVLGRFHHKALVRLSGNAKLSSSGLAPLNLCLLEGFDRKNDALLCPPERNALHAIYEDGKGKEWTDSHNWMDHYASHCSWHGVKCRDGSVEEVNLAANGLSGKLSKEIAKLPNLTVLDLSENDIKGSIPSTIGSLTKLKKLRLCYNGFVGSVPEELKELSHLEMIQVHGNKLDGTIPSPKNVHLFQEESSFVSDCGYPSFRETPLACPDCTMCCNRMSDCYENKPTSIQNAGFKDYWQLSWVLLLGVAGCSCIFYCLIKHKDSNDHTLNTDALALLIEREKEYALDLIGRDSVYKLFFGKSFVGWFIAATILVSQLLLCYLFIVASEFEFTASTDIQYNWQCPPNDPQCRDDLGRTTLGWILFAILLAAHLLKDVIKGIKLVLLSRKGRHPRHQRVSFFVGGLVLIVVSAYTAYASTVYNLAIATNDPSLIANAVIILFVTDIDELFDDIKLEIESGFPGLEEDNQNQDEEEHDEEKHDDEEEEEEDHEQEQDEQEQDGEAQAEEVQDDVERNGKWQDEDDNRRRSSLFLDLGEEEENQRRSSLLSSLSLEQNGEWQDEDDNWRRFLSSLGEEEGSKRRSSLVASFGN